MPYRQVVVALAGAWLGGVALADEESIYFSDLPVVASVSRLPQKLADAPTAVTVIDREIIKASGARDLTDVFRLVPGFQTYPNNTDAARVTYHGLTDEDFSPRVQVLVDGRSLYSPLFRNGVNWATLPVALEDIERIEVVRGSNSASYGSNAFLGVINIITVDPALVRGFSVSTNYGDQGVRDYTLRNGGKLGEAGDFRFTYQQKDDNGLRDRFDWKDSFRSRLFDFRADFTVTDRDVLQVSAGHVEAITERGRLAKNNSGLTGGNDPGWPIHDFSQSNTYLQFFWRRTLSATSDFQLRYSFVEDWASDNYVAQDSGLLYAVDEFGDHGRRHEIEAQHSFAPVDTVRLVWGAGWRADSLRSDTMFLGNPTVRREIFRLFGNAEWKPFKWFTGNLGASAEHDSLGGTHTSPRISGSFHLTPENTIRLGYSRAYRTGSIVDYRGNEWNIPFATASGAAVPSGVGVGVGFQGNPKMPAEKLDSIELGYLGDWKDWRMSLDVRLFQERIPNRLMVIDLDRNSDLIGDSTVPIQKVRINGVEYQWRWQPFETTRLMLNQAFIRVEADFLDDALANTNSTLGNTGTRNNIDLLADRSAPHHSTSALLMQKLPLGLEFSAAGYWVDRMKWTRNSEVNGYTRVDTRLGLPFHWAGRSGEVAVTVQSINGAHGEFKSYGQPSDRIVERRRWLSLRLDF
jgi:iron complex outermembrane receptor protein